VRGPFRLSAAVTSSIGRCSLPGDPAVYPETVVATVNGGTYRGCGGAPLAAGALADTSWRVLSVKGQPLAPAANATMRFDQSRLSGRFGCNSLSAPYVLSGAVMSVGAAAMTRMACPDMTAEQDAAAILTGLVTVRWEAADRLTLSAPAGAIVLVR
jgi:heat shock protein HslJ